MKITHKDVVQVYSGTPGCMCGCKGTYRDSERSKKNMLTRVLKNDYTIELFGRTDREGIAGCIFAETDTRYQVVYFGEGAKLFEDVTDEELQAEHDNELVERVNLMTGKTYWEPRKTPPHMSPAYESYWSM